MTPDTDTERDQLDAIDAWWAEMREIDAVKLIFDDVHEPTLDTGEERP